MSSALRWRMPSGGPLGGPVTLMVGIAPRSELQRGPVSSRASLAVRATVRLGLPVAEVAVLVEPGIHVLGAEPQMTAEPMSWRAGSPASPRVDRLERDADVLSKLCRRDHRWPCCSL